MEILSPDSLKQSCGGGGLKLHHGEGGGGEGGQVKARLLRCEGSPPGFWLRCGGRRVMAFHRL